MTSCDPAFAHDVAHCLLMGLLRPLVNAHAESRERSSKALDLNLPVVDASEAVLAVHQNHDYSYNPEGKKGVWEGVESQRNLALAGGTGRMRTIWHATRRLTASGRIQGTWLRRVRFEIQRTIVNLPAKVWYPALRASSSARHAVGLDRHGLTELLARFRAGRNAE